MLPRRKTIEYKSLLDETSKVTDFGKETIIDTRTDKEKLLDSDWKTEQ
jgi:hypothetical protein